ncbi:MAG: HAD hydrolase family protein, partial [Acutalibacteraceae bacterium]|nr:HAD hydrolase family protein [Acutalibacteraceae bacterium]
MELNNKTLFVSDLDGTLLNDNAQISEFTKQTLNSLISSGLMFTVASARSIISAGDILKGVNWNLNGIFMNGVLLCDIMTRKTADFCTIIESDVIKMISVFNKHNRPPSVF